MTIGDVLAVMAAVFVVGATWAATILLAALAFPAKTTLAQQKIVSAPGASVARGLGLAVVLGILAAAFWSHPGPARLIGGLLLATLGALAAVGSAGIARLVGERIQSVGSHMNPFATLTRGTILYVAAGFLPVIGWFLVAPAALLLSIGGGAAALLTRREKDNRVASHPAAIGMVHSPLASPEMGVGGTAVSGPSA